jgi:hypothetical protein
LKSWEKAGLVTAEEICHVQKLLIALEKKQAAAHASSWWWVSWILGSGNIENWLGICRYL